MPAKEHVTKDELMQVYDSSEKLALQIRQLSAGMKKLARSGLKEETIVLLLENSSNVGKPAIRAILLALRTLERDYCVPEEKKQ